ncbi:MAG TPA: hypothetical protein VMQ54_00510 [Steroidobacteraceae bacterium]|nr:hypothetical protein [Steroidobacteraceae bacterium]
MKWFLASMAVAGLLGGGAASFADDAAASAPAPAQAPAPATKHQMMKDCMAKQKASESGMPKEQMKKACRDVTATEKQNADKAATTAPSNPPANH